MRVVEREGAEVGAGGGGPEDCWEEEEFERADAAACKTEIAIGKPVAKADMIVRRRKTGRTMVDS